MEEHLKHSLAVAALGALALLGPQAGLLGPAEAAAQADTAQSAQPFAFRKTVIPNAEFLSRVIDAALERRSAPAVTVGELDVSVSPPSAGETPEGFAKRYGISTDLARTIVEVALAEGIDPELAFRLVRIESRFVTRARGPQGSLGLAQLMPSTARMLDRSLRTDAQIMEPRTNLRLGLRYLRTLIRRYDGDVRLGLLAYNRGEGTVDRVLRSGRDPENGYSHKVLGTRGRNAYRGLGVLPGR